MRNRFKGLALIDRVPEDLWTQVCDIVQEAVIKTIPKKKKCIKAKWLSEEAFFVSVGHSNQSRKRSKRNPDRKRRSETLCWQMT